MKITVSFGIIIAAILLAGLAVAPVYGGSKGQGQGEKAPVLIGFAQQPGPAEEALVRQAGGNIKATFHLVPAMAASLPEAAIDGLRHNPKVTSIDPDGQVQATDAELDNAWGVKRIGAGLVHPANKGTGVKVAIIDSGIDYQHPDLNANYVAGYDFVSNDADPMDDYGHGTHVAGTVAAVDDGSGVVGVAPEAELYALKVLNSSGSGSWSDIIAALEWAVDNGMQVTNNSYGSGANPGSIVQAAYDNSAAAGIVHVASAGNSGNRPGRGDNVEWPANYASVIAVAATDSKDKRAGFSSTGSSVELAAPGVAIRSTVPGGGYEAWNGTSMASPHVAGTAALMIAAGVTDVRGVLRSTADDLGDGGRDTKYGYGLVDADEAAGTAPPPPATTGTVEGAITSAADGSPIDGASVSVDTGQSATAAGDGTYSIADVPTGSRTVTASASGFLSRNQSAMVDENLTTTVNIALDPVPAGGTVSVGSISYATEGGKNSDKHLLVSVAVVDGGGAPVSGATVSIDLYRGGSKIASGTGTTGTGGTVTFSLKNARSGIYTTTVTDVTAAGLTWDGLTPENSFSK